MPGVRPETLGVRGESDRRAPPDPTVSAHTPSEAYAPSSKLRAEPSTSGPDLALVVLAAGKGTRMRSRLHKVLHPVAGRPMLEHVLRAAAPVGPERTVVVVGHGAAEVEARFSGMGVEFVFQREQLGTGHALLQSRELLERFDGDIMVLNGDAPLLTEAPLRSLHEHHRRTGAGMTLLTYEVDRPFGFGRVVRWRDGGVARIVEQGEVDEVTSSIREVNPGFYLFDRRVFSVAAGLRNDNPTGEYLITDLVALYSRAGHSVQAVLARDDAISVIGVNTRAQLAEAEQILRDRIRRGWLEEGVTMHCPDQTFIDDTVVLGRDVLLEPGVVLRGATRVGEGAQVGAYACLTDCLVNPEAVVAPHTVAVGVSF